MPSLQAHFEVRATELADCAALEVSERDGASTMTLRPHTTDAVGVVLYLFRQNIGTVRFDDPSSSPAELGEDMEEDLKAIDSFIDAAVEGRVTTFGQRSGGLVEVRDGGGVDRTWRNSFPLPGWKKRATVREYKSYR